MSFGRVVRAGAGPMGLGLFCLCLASACSMERPPGAGARQRTAAPTPPKVPIAEVAVAAGQVRGISGVHGDLGIAVEGVSSDSLDVHWQGVPEATTYEVRISAE